jgi:ATP-dependent DNA ligase
MTIARHAAPQISNRTNRLTIRVAIVRNARSTRLGDVMIDQFCGPGPYRHPALVPRPAALCQLAGEWRDGVPDGGAMVERKHDGWRMLWIDGKLWSRNGQEMHGVRHIARAVEILERQFDRPMMFDGEFVVPDPVNTLIATKRHAESRGRAGDAGAFWVFDCVPLERWRCDDDEAPLYERKKALQGAFGGIMTDPLSWECGWGEGVDCPLHYVADQWAFNDADVRSLANDVWSGGGEGIMVKDAMSPYRRKRTDAWRKLKQPGWAIRRMT